MAKATGRFRLGAPKCGTVTGIAIMSDTGILFRNGDSTLDNDYAAGSGTVGVALGTGFTTAGKVIVGYGLRNAEVCTVGTVAANSLGTVVLVNAHKKGERVVQCLGTNVTVTPTAIRPGSVVIKGIVGSNTTIAATDDGKGALVDAANEVGTIFSGTVDYNTGCIVVDANVSGARVMTYSADTLTDSAALTDLGGTGYFKNFVGMSLTRRDLPDFVVATNDFGVGDPTPTISFFLETSRSNGFGFEYLKGSAFQLAAGQRTVFNVPAGNGKDAIRIRVGAGSAGVSGTLEFDFGTMTNTNGE